MLDKIKSAIYNNLEVLFAEAAVHDIAGDIENLMACYQKITGIGEILGIDTEIRQVIINLKERNTDSE